MAQNKDREAYKKQPGWRRDNARRWACTLTAGAVAGLALAVSARSVPNVVAWGWTSSGGVPAYATNVVAVSDGGDHAIALRTDGSALDFWSFPSVTNVLPG